MFNPRQPSSLTPLPSMTRAEETAGFVEALRQRLFPRRNLLVGPYVGEFGVEITDWQSYVRARRRYYDSVHVITYPGHGYFYEGCQVHEHDIRLENAGYFYGSARIPFLREYARSVAERIGLSDFDHFHSGVMATRWHRKLLWRQEFRRFQEAVPEGGGVDVLFHFRQIDKSGPDKTRNYRRELVEDLVRRCLEDNLKLGCMGHPLYSFCPEGCRDFRSTDLRQSVAAICGAKIVVGELSGPLHLANYCGKGTVIWAPGRWRIRGALCRNPFKVPIHVVDDNSTNPEPAKVLAVIRGLSLGSNVTGHR